MSGAQTVLADVSWTAASTSWWTGDLSAIAEDGTFMTIKSGQTAQCSSGEELVAMAASSVVTKQGDVLSLLAAGPCLRQSLGKEVRAASTVICGASQNPWWLTETALIGSKSCVELP